MKEYCDGCGFEFFKDFPFKLKYEKFKRKDGKFYCFPCMDKLREKYH